MSKKGFTYTLQIDAEINDLIAKTNQVKKSMQSVMDVGKAPGAEKIFASLEKAMDRLQQKAGSPITSLGDFASIQKDAQAVATQLSKLGGIVEGLANMGLADKMDLLPPDLKKKIEQAETALQAYTAATEKAAKKSKELTDAENDLATAKRDLTKAEGRVESKKQLITIQEEAVKAAKAETKAIEAKKVALEKFVKTQAAYEAAGGDRRKAGGGKEELAGMNLPADRKAAQAAVPGLDLKDAQAIQAEIARLGEEYRIASKAVTDAESTQRNYGKQLREASNAALVAKNKVSDLEGMVAGLNAEFEENKAKDTQAAYAKLRTEAGKLGVDLKNIPIDYTEQNLIELNNTLNQLAMDGIAKVDQDVGNLQIEFSETGAAAETFGNKMHGAEAEVNKLDATVSNTTAFTERIKQFVGLQGGIEIARSAMRNAMSTIKELDKAMTEMAVVTEFEVGDYWNQLPEYTERANALGVSIKSAYESATLYYQQGLKTNEVVAMSNETLKMARIAGLSAEDATNKMTAALRGFNMELNETSAQRVADVYSELAAITASDVDEISSAMTKTASIAASAGMKFETTAAFLSQIIETTRESAETAGTALKTVVARFQELKKDPADIGEVDGEVVDANKIETALRSVGVALRDTSGQFRELDDVFLELSGKWDSLDTNTQRYIATIAAGSRQQSRFIAMMSDYSRTTELVAAANTSAGASQEQFEKTMESLESKLNELKNAWDSFTMGIMNSEVIKAGIDLLTGLLNILNRVSNWFGAFSGAAKIGMLVAALYLGDKALKVFTASLRNGSTIFGAFGKVGSTAIQKLQKGFIGLKKQIAKLTGKKINIDFKPATIATEQYNAALVKANEAEKMRKAATAGAQKDVVALATADKLAAEAEEAKTKAVYEYAAAQGLTTAQASTSLVLQAMGVSANVAEAAAIGGLTTAKVLEYQAGMIAQGVTSSEIATRMIQIATLYAEAGAEGTSTAAKATGIAAIWAKIAAFAVSIPTTIIQTMATWGLVAAEYAASPPLWLLVAVIAVLVIAIAGLVLLIIGLIAAFKQMKANSPEGQLKAAEAATEAAAEAAEEAAEAYNNLVESLDSLDDKYQALNELTRGTKEWSEAMREINNQVLELVEQYPELAKLVKNKDGVLTLDIDSEEAQEIIDQYELKSLQAKNAELASKISVAQKTRDVSYKNLSGKAELGSQFGLTMQKIGAVAATAALASTNTFSGAGAGHLLWTDANEKRDTNKVNTNNLAEALAKGLIAQDEYGQYNVIEGSEQELADLGLTVDAIKEFTKELGDGAEELKAYGLRVQESKEQEKALYEALALNASSLVDTTNMSAKQIAQIGVAANQEYIEHFMEEAEKEIDRIKEQYGKKAEREELEILGQKVYGDKEIKVKRNKVIIGTGDDAEEIDRDEYEAQIEAAMATEKAADSLASLSQTIQKVSNSLGKAGKSFEKAYLGKEGAKMTKADVDELDKGQEYWENYFNKLEKSEQDALGGFESFYSIISDAVEIPKQAFKDIEEEFKAYGAHFEISDSFTTEMAQGYSEHLKTALIESGQDAMNEVNQYLEAIRKSMSAEDFEKFVSQLNAVDWDDLSSWEKLPDTLKEIGLNVPQKALEDFIDSAAEASQAIRKAELSKIVEDVQSLQKLQKDISSNEQYRTFESGVYESLIEKIPALKEQFQLDEEGNYIYLGQSMKDLQIAIEENTAAILSETLEKLSAQNDVGQLIKESFKSVAYNGNNYDLEDGNNWSDMLKASWVQSVQAAIKKEGLDFSQLGIENFGKETDIYTLYNNDKDAVIEIFNSLTELYTNYSEQAYQKLISVLTTEEMSKNAVASGVEGKQLRKEAKTEIEQFDDLKRAKLKVTANNIILKALQAGVNKLDIELYNKAISKLKEMWELGEAATNTAEYQQLLEYIDQIENKLIDATNITALNNNIQTTLEKFAEMAEVINNVADEGTKIELIQKAVEDLGITITESNADLVVNLIRNILVGGKQGYEGLQILFESAAISAGLSGQQAGELWLNGWQGSLDTLREEFEGLYELFNLFANVGLGAWTIDENTNQASFERITELQYTTNLSQSGAQIEEWETSYDWLYNANEKMNALIREREKAERAYNKALKDSSVTAEKLKEATEAELAALEKQAQVAVNQIEAANASINALFTNNPEFAQFVSTSEDGRITIDYEGAEKAFGTNPEQGEAFEEFISITEELVEAVLDSQDTLEEIADTTEEIQERGKNEYLDLEQRVYDAIIYQYESEIEKLENINSAIEEGNNNLISAIQAGIDEARQARENEKTEQDITDKQTRLAYLQMDTSGANALEILQLQKEIEEASESYQDSLIDQAIQKLQESNDEAAQQRELQIALLNSQLQVAKDSGALWVQFKELWNNAFNEDGQLNMESSMVKTLQSKDGWAGMSTLAKEDWAKELQQDGALAKMFDQGYGDDKNGTIPTMLQNIKTLTDTNTGVVVTNKTVADNFDKKLSETPATFANDNSYAKLFTGVSSVITGNGTNSSNLFGIDSSITTGASDLSTALTTMFTNAQSAIDKAKEEAERNANQYADSGDGSISTTIEGLHPNDFKNPFNTTQPNTFSTDFGQNIIDTINANNNLNGSSGFEISDDTRSVLKREAPSLWQAVQAAAKKIEDWFNGEEENAFETETSSLTLEEFEANMPDSAFKAAQLAKLNSGEITYDEYVKALEQRGLLPFKTGGLADFTGPAWLDGTKSRPELVLNQQDTANFIELKDILAEILAGTATVSRAESGEKGGDNYYDIEISVENISEDYDIEQLAEKIKTMIYEDSVYRNVNTINLIR